MTIAIAEISKRNHIEKVFKDEGSFGGQILRAGNKMLDTTDIITNNCAVIISQKKKVIIGRRLCTRPNE